MSYNLNISSFFGTNTNNSSSGLFGLSSMLSDYNLIRSGSYGKLMKAYYSDADKDTAKNKTNSILNQTTTSTAKDDSATIKELQSSTDDLTATAKELYTTGTKSVFNQKSVTDEKGNTTKQYDTDAIYKKVKSFVDDYNDVMTAGAKSKDSKVTNSVKGMANATKTEENMLGKLGIAIGSDNQLSIDEDTFKKADMSVAKSLFKGTGSYAYTIATKSAMTNSYADMEADKSNTYNKYGNYGNTYSQGSLYNSYF